MDGNLVAGRYVINGIIGSGGMAIVYRGYDRESGTEVAIKVLRSEYMQDEAYVRRFEKESQIAIKYSHRNIVKTLEVGKEEGRHFIVMEYVSGMTLKEHIAKLGRVKPGEAVRLGRQICDALFYAHSHQLVHRDIKPQNILLTPEGTVKVADFGIAKAPETATVTISGSNVLGSVHYISPEQARGGLTDEKTDIYSIGIVLYEMVTGFVPFTGDSPVAVALKHLQDMPKPPRETVPDIPKALELVILKAISKEQAARYDNAREMARDLERSILEPEGAYVKIKQPDETDGTRPMHPLKAENLQMQQTGSWSNTGQTRRPPAPPRPDNKWRKKSRTQTALNVALFVLLALVLLGGAYLGIRLVMNSAVPERVQLKEFKGMDVEIAKQQIIKMNLKPEVTTEPSDSVNKNVVMDQSPKKDEFASAGDTVYLTVSSGKRQVEVPPVVNLTYQEAVDKIQSSGLTVGRVGFDDKSDKPKDTVLKQMPESGTMLPMSDGKVDIVLSRPQEPSVQTMPNVFGKNKEQAIDDLMAMGIKVNSVIKDKPSSYLKDIVIGQTPEAGITIDSSTIVELTVSDGTPPGYHKKEVVEVDVTADDTLVKIVYVDGEERTTMYYDKRNAGKLIVNLDLDTMTLGDKTIITYFNDVEVQRKTATFS